MWLTRQHHVDIVLISHAQITWSKHLIMKSASAVPYSSNVLLCQWWTQGWNWGVAFSLPVPKQMAILKGEVHVTDEHITWITCPCHMLKSHDLKISSWRLLVLLLLLADNVLLCQWWTKGWNWGVAFSLPVPTEMVIKKGVLHMTDTPTSFG